MVHALTEDEIEDQAVRDLQVQFAIAGREAGDVITARAALSLFAVTTARLASSPDDAIAGVRAAVADLEEETRELWMLIHGVEHGGSA